jgi:hypothetical protein
MQICFWNLRIACNTDHVLKHMGELKLKQRNGDPYTQENYPTKKLFGRSNLARQYLL